MNKFFGGLRKKGRSHSITRGAGKLFALPSLVGLFGLFVIPFAISIVLSFNGGIGGFTFSGFRNYGELFRSKSFLLSCGNTLRLMAVGIPALLVLALINAMGIRRLTERNIPGHKVVFVFHLIPLVLPSFIIVQLVRMFFSADGVVNQCLLSMGGQPVSFDQKPFVFWLFVGLYLWKNLGYGMVVFLAGMQGIPDALYEAAVLDGAGPVSMAGYITVPLLMPNILFNIMVAVMSVFKMYRESYLLYGSYPDSSIYFIQNYMNNHFYALNYAQLAASSVVFFLVIAVGLAVLIKMIGRRNEIW